MNKQFETEIERIVDFFTDNEVIRQLKDLFLLMHIYTFEDLKECDDDYLRVHLDPDELKFIENIRLYEYDALLSRMNRQGDDEVNIGFGGGTC